MQHRGSCGILLRWPVVATSHRGQSPSRCASPAMRHPESAYHAQASSCTSPAWWSLTRSRQTTSYDSHTTLPPPLAERWQRNKKPLKTKRKKQGNQKKTSTKWRNKKVEKSASFRWLVFLSEWKPTFMSRPCRAKLHSLRFLWICCSLKHAVQIHTKPKAHSKSATSCTTLHEIEVLQ